eukprot:1878556-Prymnesium_polylepis.2
MALAPIPLSERLRSVSCDSARLARAVEKATMPSLPIQFLYSPSFSSWAIAPLTRAALKDVMPSLPI